MPKPHGLRRLRYSGLERKLGIEVCEGHSEIEDEKRRYTEEKSVELSCELLQKKGRYRDRQIRVASTRGHAEFTMSLNLATTRGVTTDKTVETGVYLNLRSLTRLVRSLRLQERKSQGGWRCLD